MDIRNIALICISAVALCNLAFSITITCDFKCNSNDGSSTMSHYSQLQGTWQDEGERSLGYEAGSFSYLADGWIEFEDTVDYRDSNKANDNPSLHYGMMASFEGREGISEFSARGIYPSNREIYSIRKVRYENLSISSGGSYNFGSSSNCPAPGNSTIGPDLVIAAPLNCRDEIKSNLISVDANVDMDQARKGYGGYNLVYNASVESGIVNTWDSSGWANKLGDSRTEWEQVSLMRGNISVEGNLLARDLNIYDNG